MSALLSYVTFFELSQQALCDVSSLCHCVAEVQTLPSLPPSVASELGLDQKVAQTKGVTFRCIGNHFRLHASPRLESVFAQEDELFFA